MEALPKVLWEFGLNLSRRRDGLADYLLDCVNPNRRNFKAYSVKLSMFLGALPEHLLEKN